MTGVLWILALAIIGWVIYRAAGKKKKAYQPIANTGRLLNEHVKFYRELSAANKKLFEARLNDFLAHVTITGIGVTVEDLDKLLIAAGAIIPIFAFPSWRYNNISEVLLYKGTFNKEYQTEGADRNVLGMVGEGALNRQMILSKQSVHTSFAQETDGHNTVIHEFTHLIDKADGSTDGVPEYLLDKQHTLPWLNLMHETIAEMKRKGNSDINLYGATNQAEFFAVVAEYFFEKPQALQEKHPELYDMLKEMFQPANS
ncbi:MAG: zinc-dependent peptidase [Sphingobacteriales bacterium]|nr:MAG: zinc-dependent peptidase [Sphingobacteriales bacterium]